MSDSKPTKSPQEILAHWKMLLESRIRDLTNSVDAFKSSDRSLVTHDRRDLFQSNLSLLKFSQRLHDEITLHSPKVDPSDTWKTMR